MKLEFLYSRFEPQILQRRKIFSFNYFSLFLHKSICNKLYYIQYLSYVGIIGLFRLASSIFNTEIHMVSYKGEVTPSIVFLLFMVRHGKRDCLY